ncbi:hypothetical protein CPS_3855 [Colwellia psychrerythraea 34H]|uniref:Uncharacterized protein n=1 Tax=Colwellia psychrerythraea (strain 34H / ATCC BAA-681) TaxID=167879 RepID=Q47XF3_COLP3|nr:hypothetical protein CPS_3855 [Colwellia psychrerythraea 34H]
MSILKLVLIDHLKILLQIIHGRNRGALADVFV